MFKMEDSYLHADGKGIFPHDLEDKAEYMIRAMKMQESGNSPFFKNSLLNNIDKDYPKYLLQECKAPDAAYKLMESKFGCDVSWIPYFKTGKYRVQDNAKELLRDAMGWCKVAYRGHDQVMLPYVLVLCNAFERSTAIHEFIHAARFLVIDRHKVKRDAVLSELFAEADQIVPMHNVFAKYPLHTVKEYVKMVRAHCKLKGAFGDKADYAFVRLKEEELDDINSISRDNVKSYFKMRTAYMERNNTVSTDGRLRFQIMCEKLGL